MGFRLGLRFGPGSDLRIWVVADSERPRVFDVGLAKPGGPEIISTYWRSIVSGACCKSCLQEEALREKASVHAEVGQGFVNPIAASA